MKLADQVSQKKTNRPDNKLGILMFVYPIASMYGIFTHICHKTQPNVGRYTIHGRYLVLSCRKHDLEICELQICIRNFMDQADQAQRKPLEINRI